ncbi:MAG: hypothetical protein IJ754_03100 [Bacteroidaceae bacterium]|nr:hypothetical protein [Bacteroidaceae bacterium]
MNPRRLFLPLLLCLATVALPGHFLTRTYKLQPQAKVLAAMKTLMRQLEHQPRTHADKVYWHKAY